MEEEPNLKDKILAALKEKESVWIRDICLNNKVCYKETFALGKYLETHGAVKVVHEKRLNKLVRGENFLEYLKGN